MNERKNEHSKSVFIFSITAQRAVTFNKVRRVIYIVITIEILNQSKRLIIFYRLLKKKKIIKIKIKSLQKSACGIYSA